MPCILNSLRPVEPFSLDALIAGSAINSNQFRIGTGATTPEHRSIYNATNGFLLFDADGIGTIAPSQIATLPARLTLTHQDIFVTA